MAVTPGNLNVRPLATQIRTSDKVSPTILANALSNVQASLDTIEEKFLGLSEPYNRTNTIRVHGSNLVPGSVSGTYIDTINANQIVGLIQAGQIYQVNANQIAGALVADQIGSVNADVILGVIVTEQLADNILDTAKLFADAFKPIQRVDTLPGLPDANYPVNSLVLLSTDKKIYKNVAGTWTVTAASDTLIGHLTAVDIDQVNATAIIGLITAAQIDTINATQIAGLIQAGQINTVGAGQITGQLTASQIASVNASAITGTIVAAQIASVNASAITGLVQAGQINTVAATQITGTLTADQIASVYATALSGLVQAAQINTVAAGQITGQLTASQIASVSASTITGTVTADQIASVYASVLSGLVQAAQINTLTAGQITGQLVASQILSVNASAITGTITAAQIASVNASVISGLVQAAQINTLTAGQITGTIVGSQIGTLVVTGDHIVNLTITGGKLADGTITNAKIDTISASKITTGELKVTDTDVTIVKAFPVGHETTKYFELKIETETGNYLPRVTFLLNETIGVLYNIKTVITPFDFASVDISNNIIGFLSYAGVGVRVVGGKRAELVADGLKIWPDEDLTPVTLYYNDKIQCDAKLDIYHTASTRLATFDTTGISFNTDLIRIETSKTPASAGASGNAGEICWDSGYVYVCTASNTWKRAAIATW